MDTKKQQPDEKLHCTQYHTVLSPQATSCPNCGSPSKQQAVGSVCVFHTKASILIVVLAGRFLAAAMPLA